MHAPVGIFYRKSVLVIDGKNNNDDGKNENHKLRGGENNTQRSNLGRKSVSSG
jgi:hypothetical protein